MVFQSYALYPHMTVAQEHRVPARREPGDRVPSPPSANDASPRQPTTLGLTDYLDRKPGELSGGQRQRVALARAIVRGPEVFLMDEPLSNLDAKLRTQTRLELVELHRRLGTTFVYVTHDQVEAMTMADRIAIISDGRLQQVGASQAVYERPENLFVASFIGSPPMNTIAGTRRRRRRPHRRAHRGGRRRGRLARAGGRRHRGRGRASALSTCGSAPTRRVSQRASRTSSCSATNVTSSAWSATSGMIVREPADAPPLAVGERRPARDGPHRGPPVRRRDQRTAELTDAPTSERSDERDELPVSVEIATPPEERRRRAGRRMRDALLGYAFLAPAIVVFVGVLLLPALPAVLVRHRTASPGSGTVRPTSSAPSRSPTR